jgi:hypothetical protein
MNTPPAATDPRDVVNQRDLAWPREAIFAAMTDPERLARWWGPAGFSNRVEHCDLRPGGHWLYTMVGPDGTEYPNESRFTAIEPPARLVIEHLSGHHFELLVTLDALPGGGTRLTWRQRFDTAEHRDEIVGFVAPANEQNLDRLEAELARPGQR